MSDDQYKQHLIGFHPRRVRERDSEREVDGQVDEDGKKTTTEEQQNKTLLASWREHAHKHTRMC